MVTLLLAGVVTLLPTRVFDPAVDVTLLLTVVMTVAQEDKLDVASFLDRFQVVYSRAADQVTALA